MNETQGLKLSSNEGKPQGGTKCFTWVFQDDGGRCRGCILRMFFKTVFLKTVGPTSIQSSSTTLLARRVAGAL
jgi:hypothetical protein